MCHKSNLYKTKLITSSHTYLAAAASFVKHKCFSHVIDLSCQRQTFHVWIFKYAVMCFFICVYHGFSGICPYCHVGQV